MPELFSFTIPVNQVTQFFVVVLNQFLNMRLWTASRLVSKGTKDVLNFFPRGDAVC